MTLTVPKPRRAELADNRTAEDDRASENGSCSSADAVDRTADAQER